MYFHHKKAILYSTIAVLVFLILIQLFTGFVLKIVVFSLVFLLGVVIYQLGYYWILEENILFQYIFFREVCRIEIRKIECIEAITTKKFGEVYIQIGKGFSEDTYRFILKDSSTFTSLSSCRNKQGLPLGRYLQKHYKIKLIEKEKVKFFNV